MKRLCILPLLGLVLSSCSFVNQTMNSLQANRDAIDVSTYAIMENTQAIENASRTIQENRSRLQEINKTLEKAGK